MPCKVDITAVSDRFAIRMHGTRTAVKRSKRGRENFQNYANKMKYTGAERMGMPATPESRMLGCAGITHI